MAITDSLRSAGEAFRVGGRRPLKRAAWSRGWRSDTVWGVRLWIPYAALPIGFALFLLQLVADLVAVVLKIDPPFGLEDN